MPAAIFAVKVLEYLLSTMQTLAVVRGQAGLAAGISLADTIIWLMTLSFTINRRDWRSFAAYAAGASLGTFLGVQ